jgi:hypothetical protein
VGQLGELFPFEVKAIMLISIYRVSSTALLTILIIMGQEVR